METDKDKIAGVGTIEAEVSPEESINILKEAVQIYHDLDSNWQLNEESYAVARKAVSLNKSLRYMSFDEFFHDRKIANRCKMYFCSDNTR